MAERKVIHIQPGGENERLLKLVSDEPISVELGGERFRIEREKRDPFEDYDPERALASLRKGVGLFTGFDVEEFKRDIREQRGQDSIGRPAE